MMEAVLEAEVTGETTLSLHMTDSLRYIRKSREKIRKKIKMKERMQNVRLVTEAKQKVCSRL